MQLQIKFQFSLEFVELLVQDLNALITQSRDQVIAIRHQIMYVGRQGKFFKPGAIINIEGPDGIIAVNFRFGGA